MRVAFASKYYEKDWFHAITDFENKANCCMYPFDTTIIALNNVSDVNAVENALLEVADTVVSAERSLQRILSSFNLKETPNVYALGELTAVYGAREHDYLVFVQGDCLVYPAVDWITPGLKILEQEPNVMVVSPASEVNTWHDAEGYDHYMSDHAFLIRVKDFLNPAVYNVEGIDKDYPKYGGNSFEHMVGKYLKATNRTRKILPIAYTLHPTY